MHESDGKENIFEMLTNDELTIFPHQRHRVDYTDPGESGGTIWIAIFWQESSRPVREVVGEDLWAQIEAIKH